MKTKTEIAAIVESIANGRATFEETYLLGLYSAEEMDEYLTELMEA